MSWKYKIEHYENPDNKRKEDVIDFMMRHNDEFSNFDLTLEEQANEWMADKDESFSGREAIEVYYDSLCDELVVVLDENDIIGCRFVEFDEDDEFFRERVPDYEIGLNLTFALVDRDYRKEGVWSRMFKFVEKNVISNYDVNRFYLATSSENEGIQNAMEKHNFKKANKIKDERGEGRDSLIYYKDLD